MSFHTFKTKIYNTRLGGYTAPRAVSPNDLRVWDKVLALTDTSSNFADKGIPISVQTAVVAGIKFRFAFEDGSTVTVWRSLGNVISIVKH